MGFSPRPSNSFSLVLNPQLHIFQNREPSNGHRRQLKSSTKAATPEPNFMALVISMDLVKRPSKKTRLIGPNFWPHTKGMYIRCMKLYVADNPLHHIMLYSTESLYQIAPSLLEVCKVRSHDPDMDQVLCAPKAEPNKAIQAPLPVKSTFKPWLCRLMQSLAVNGTPDPSI